MAGKCVPMCHSHDQRPQLIIFYPRGKSNLAWLTVNGGMGMLHTPDHPRHCALLLLLPQPMPGNDNACDACLAVYNRLT